MKVLQKRILILVICSNLISVLLVIAIAFHNFAHSIESNSEQIMQLMCSEKKQAIDEKLINIEQSVDTIYYYAVRQISENENLWQEEDLYTEHINRMRALMEATAEYTNGAVTVYYRLNDSVRGLQQGVWLVQDENGKFIEQEVTNISLYDKEDIEHVGWYYIPIGNGKETWINPYYNQNMGEEIISYVIPIIMDEQVLGVVGMDISTSILYQNAKSVTVSDSGYAFLMDNKGEFVYHPEMKENKISKEFNNKHAYLYETSMVSAYKRSVEAYEWNGTDKYMTAQILRNGMIFAVCITEEEMKAPQNKMLKHSIFVIMMSLSAFVVIAVSITKAIVKLMYTDTMTRVGNKTAYAECVEELNKQIRKGEKTQFVAFVLDVNDLKKVNDNYGHDYGDLLIQSAASILRQVWGSKFVYRIGGDEFSVICTGMKLCDAEKKLLLFEEEIIKYNRQNNDLKLYLQMAIGMAVYRPGADEEYMDVFRRADEEMYIDKNRKKKKNG